MHDENLLVEKCQNGDNQAFGELYDMYFTKIYKFIYYKTSHKPSTEDLVSLTFTKALEKINTFKSSKGTFSAWIYQIARNSVTDYYRTRKQYQDIDTAIGVYQDDKIEETMTNQQQLEKIKEDLDQLTEQQREIVIMRVWNELSYKEISQITGKSEASCKMAFSRAIKQLKNSLALILTLITSIINL